MSLISYYRAALAAAFAGDLTNAVRLVRCSLALREEAPYAERLLELLHQQRDHLDADTLNRLHMLTVDGRYKKALQMKLPQSSQAHTIRGLLYALIGRYRHAREEFALSLALDKGNDLAQQALLECAGKKRVNRHDVL